MGIKVGNLEFATAGDLIVGGGAFSIGFGIDAFLFSGGATSTEAGGASMAGALALKYGIQKAFERLSRDQEREGPLKPPPDAN